jgi:glycosyltransferase involved in cell wall biosynthesis
MRRELKFSLASRACDRVVAVCERARLNLREAPFAARAKIVRIYNAACEPCRQNTPLLAKSGFTLLHVGRLTPVKQQETLVQAFALAQAEVCNLRLWIVGDGPLRLSLEQLVQRLGISASVTFFGEQANVAPFFASADLFVMSSITEGVPISLLEAMSAGLPAVVTDVGGMAEVALLSEALTTAPPSNPAALASAICAVAQSQVQLPQLRDASRRCYLRNFTPERMADEYFRVYDGSSLHEAGY